jgi:hypothetical protein
MNQDSTPGSIGRRILFIYSHYYAMQVITDKGRKVATRGEVVAKYHQRREEITVYLSTKPVTYHVSSLI